MSVNQNQESVNVVQRGPSIRTTAYTEEERRNARLSCLPEATNEQKALPLTTILPGNYVYESIENNNVTALGEPVAVYGRYDKKWKVCRTDGMSIISGALRKEFQKYESAVAAYGIVIGEQAVYGIAEAHAIDMLPHQEVRFFEWEFYAQLTKVIAKCTPAELGLIVDSMMAFGLSKETVLNHIRFSFLWEIPDFDIAIEEESRNGLWNVNFFPLNDNTIPAGPALKARVTSVMVRENISSDSTLFSNGEEMKFAVLLTMHAWCKEYKVSAYDATIKARQQAFFANLQGSNAPASVVTFQPYITHLFDKTNLSTFHDWLPKVVRRVAYQTAYLSSHEGWIAHILQLMEYKGMSILKECYNMTAYEPPRNFFKNAVYHNDLRLFRMWWDQHATNVHFRYLWWVKPDELEGVTHAKLTNLLSLTWKKCFSEGKMLNYESKILNKDTIPLEHLQINTGLMRTNQQTTSPVDQGTVFALYGITITPGFYPPGVATSTSMAGLPGHQQY